LRVTIHGEPAVSALQISRHVLVRQLSHRSLDVGRPLDLVLDEPANGLDPARLSIEDLRRFGIIIGSGGGSQEFTEQQYELFFHDKQRQMSVHCVPTTVMGTLASDLSIRFGLRGPSHVVTTGCTSSTDALNYATRQIQSGRADCILSGGADSPIALGIVKGFILMKIMTSKWNHAPEKGSRPFSVDRDGFVIFGLEVVAGLVDLQVEHALPPVRAQDRQGVGEMGGVPVVHRDDDRRTS
jgi:3-oxoacyl-[acyl-carrier-protein] synthase II